MSLIEKIAQMYYYYMCEFGEEPNELHIPEKYHNEYDVIVGDMPYNASQECFAGMRVFSGKRTLSVGWTEETAQLKPS